MLHRGWGVENIYHFLSFLQDILGFCTNLGYLAFFSRHIYSVSPLQILSSQEEWYKAELRSHEGYVPKNFIDFHVPQ